ncbi:MAG: hybrid sensor histidine kinase/response regulator [Pleurocapsa minor HA4230-MV1]|jgi:signal transduction histidine kinase|nr:hybrid sensor histidine kinase/response regulator [Pleurocapsa minor HA4230-MV1]
MSKSSVEISQLQLNAGQKAIAILLIEDDLAEARLIQEILRNFDLNQFVLTHVQRLQTGLNQLKQQQFDLVLLDLTLPDSQGLSSVELLVQNSVHLPIVVLTNTNDNQLAIEAVRRGAQDYLVKRKINIDVLVRSIQYAIERQKASDLLRETNENLTNQIQQKTSELMKAKEINHFQSELVSMFSHDFRNPLTTVLSCTELLHNKNDLLSEERKVYLFQMLRNASKDMVQLLDEVLLVGQTESDTFQCNLTELNLELFCLELAEQLQFNANKKQIEVVFEARGKITQSAWDESLLKHILGNILANAIKYSPEGNKVLFELIPQTQDIVFRIQDWGIGIPSQDHHNLFQPFHRASNVGRIPGTGLGLAIAKSCVEAHQGQIVLDSEVDRGTIVTVTLPLLFLKPKIES